MKFDFKNRKSGNSIFKSRIILPLITLFCLTGFILSLVFPNQVLDTFIINMSQEEGDEEVLLPLSCGEKLLYIMNTNGLAMKGIQVGISKQGQNIDGQTLVYRVYLDQSEDDNNQITEKRAETVLPANTETNNQSGSENKQPGSEVTDQKGNVSYEYDRQKEVIENQKCARRLKSNEQLLLLSENRYDLSLGDDGQYVYLPFENYEQCNGKLYITFEAEIPLQMQDTPMICPYLILNHTTVKNTRTIPIGPILESDFIIDKQPAKEMQNKPLSLKGNYVYTHNTYPFLYDLRIMTFVFLAVSMTVTYSTRTSKREKKEKD